MGILPGSTCGTRTRPAGDGRFCFSGGLGNLSHPLDIDPGRGHI